MLKLSFWRKLYQAVCILSAVLLTFCNEAPRYWGCVNGNCYYSSYTFMTQFQASQYCFSHNLTSGLANADDYLQMRGVPYAGNYTWTGIQRYVQDSWKFLSGKEPPAPTVAAERSSQNCGYQKRTQFFGEECYVKKKYVCQGQGITGESDYSIHHTPLGWHKARNDCFKRGSDLYDPFHQGNPGYKLFEDSDEHFWIGLTKEIWSWTATGKQVNTSHWTDTQPHGNGTCVSFTVNGWYVSDCSRDLAQALCVRIPKTEPEPSTTSTMSSQSTSSTGSNSETQSAQAATLSPADNNIPPSESTLSPSGNNVPSTESAASSGSTTKTKELGAGSTSTTKSSVDGRNLNQVPNTDGTAEAQDDQDDRNKIIGGAIGGSLTLIAIVVIAVIIILRRKKARTRESPFDEPIHGDLPETGPYYNAAASNTPEIKHYENGGVDQPPSLNPYENLRSGPDLNPEIRPASPDRFMGSADNISPMYSTVPPAAVEERPPPAEERHFSNDTPQPLDPSVIYAMPMKRKIQPR